MGIVRVLPEHISNLIAAGEVVERPASVVKELMENSIDAGATALTVEIADGGMTYIRVSDNGCGMTAEDAETAFKRHATSKIGSENDLESIGTLGFRGEALAAISSVSRTELMTRTHGEETGVLIGLEAGEIVSRTPAGCPEGTTIIVRDLFFNTPARLKFMKNDTAEASAVLSAVIKTALSHPEISAKYIRGGKEELHTPGDNVLKNCIYSAMGRDFALNLLPVNWRDENVNVSGFVTSPRAGRGNRAYEHFFVNGRGVKSPGMAAGLEAAYKNSMMSGRFPGCVLHLELKASAVDVNVHPAKTEVKFFAERSIYDAVYRAVKDAIEHEGSPADEREAAEFPATWKNPNEPASGFQDTNRRAGLGHGTLLRDSGADFARLTRRPLLPGMGIRDRIEAREKEETPPDSLSPARFSPRGGQNDGQLSFAQSDDAAPLFRVVGEVMKTYIIVEQTDKLILIDKHAAHERLVYDRLMRGGDAVMSQTLMTPETYVPAPPEYAALIENAEETLALGFLIEDFGGGSLIVRQAPADIDIGEIVPLLSEIASALMQGGGDMDSSRKSIYESMACKAAVKAGRDSDPEQLKALAGRVLSGEVRYCPHGRPVATEFSKQKLDKIFGRA